MEFNYQIKTAQFAGFWPNLTSITPIPWPQTARRPCMRQIVYFLVIFRHQISTGWSNLSLKMSPRAPSSYTARGPNVTHPFTTMRDIRQIPTINYVLAQARGGNLRNKGMRYQRTRSLILEIITIVWRTCSCIQVSQCAPTPREGF